MITDNDSAMVRIKKLQDLANDFRYEVHPKIVSNDFLPKRFCAYFHFCGWENVSLGIHFCMSLPNVEIHLPFGFVRLGWKRVFPASSFVIGRKEYRANTFGYEGKA